MSHIFAFRRREMVRAGVPPLLILEFKGRRYSRAVHLKSHRGVVLQSRHSAPVTQNRRYETDGHDVGTGGEHQRAAGDADEVGGKDEAVCAVTHASVVGHREVELLWAVEDDIAEVEVGNGDREYAIP